MVAVRRDDHAEDIIAKPVKPRMSAWRKRVTIWFDGGCRPNPGPMKTAVVSRGETHFRDNVGDGDSSLAEWLALHHAVELAVLMEADDVLLVGDSVTVIRQALGDWRCRDARVCQHLDEFRKAAAGIRRIHLKHVPRSKNLAGAALERSRWR